MSHSRCWRVRVPSGWPASLLHYVGPGESFAPISYTIPCLSFDLVVAAYIAVAYGPSAPGRVDVGQ